MKKKKIVGEKQMGFLMVFASFSGCLVYFSETYILSEKREKYIVSAEKAEAFRTWTASSGAGLRQHCSRTAVPLRMLNDRPEPQGLSALYKGGCVRQNHMSGDHGRVNYGRVRPHE